MANEQNLTHPPITDSEQARKMGKKGGAVRSPAKKLAAQLRELKKKPTEANLTRMFDIMTDSKMSSLDIYRHVIEMKEKAYSFKDFDMIIGRLIDVHKLVHGTKVIEKHEFKFDGDINIKLSVDEKSDLLNELHKANVIDAEVQDK